MSDTLPPTWTRCPCGGQTVCNCNGRLPNGTAWIYRCHEHGLHVVEWDGRTLREVPRGYQADYSWRTALPDGMVVA